MNICSLIKYKYNGLFEKKIPINTYGKVSKPFINEMESTISDYPRIILSKLQKGRLLDGIRLAPKASDAFPDCPETQKIYRENFLPGTKGTFDELCYGISNTLENGRKFIGFFESPSHGDKANKGTVGHELGHKINEWLKKAIGIEISQTESFKEVVRNDLIELPERIKEHPDLHQKWGEYNINYVTQGSRPYNLKPYGLKEIFAECCAANTTETASEIRIKSKVMKVFFPESYKYVKKFLYLMGMR